MILGILLSSLVIINEDGLLSNSFEFEIPDIKNSQDDLKNDSESKNKLYASIFWKLKLKCNLFMQELCTFGTVMDGVYSIRDKYDLSKQYGLSSTIRWDIQNEKLSSSAFLFLNHNNKLFYFGSADYFDVYMLHTYIHKRFNTLKDFDYSFRPYRHFKKPSAIGISINFSQDPNKLLIGSFGLKARNDYMGYICNTVECSPEIQSDEDDTNTIGISSSIGISLSSLFNSVNSLYLLLGYTSNIIQDKNNLYTSAFNASFVFKTDKLDFYSNIYFPQKSIFSLEDRVIFLKSSFPFLNNKIEVQYHSYNFVSDDNNSAFSIYNILNTDFFSSLQVGIGISKDFDQKIPFPSFFISLQ